MLKKSFLLLKKRFASLFLLELVFWFSLLFFIIYIKEKFLGYITFMNQFAPQLTALQQAAGQDALNNAEALALLSAFESVTSSALFFGFIVVPVVLFLLWVIFQSLSWFVIKDNSIKSFKLFFWKFSFVSLIVFFFSFLILRSFVNEMFISSALDASIGYVMLTLFIASYVLLVLSACLGNDSLKQSLKRFFFVGVKRCYLVFFPVLLFFTVFSSALFLFLSLFVSQTTGTFFLLPAVPLILYSLVCLVLLVWLKIFLQLRIAEIK